MIISENENDFQGDQKNFVKCIIYLADSLNNRELIYSYGDRIRKMFLVDAVKRWKNCDPTKNNIMFVYKNYMTLIKISFKFLSELCKHKRDFSLFTCKPIKVDLEQYAHSRPQRLVFSLEKSACSVGSLLNKMPFLTLYIPM